MHVLGTAGHVDHGKSTLVKALTGIDPDRLPEEKERGLTIELGFAWFETEAGPLGVVDVPGHEKFVRTMVAGAGGIDIVLLVVAADDGWMPQTQEHLDILKLLDIPAGLSVITKCDLAEATWIGMVEDDIRAKTKGTFLEGAPIVRTDALSGKGLGDLRSRIAEVQRATQARADRGRGRLAVDRVFTMAGQGTVVTGTLRDGSFRTDETVHLFPSGRTARMRSLQTHKHQLPTATPGSRVAVNLSGVEKEELHRGMWLYSEPPCRMPRFVGVELTMVPILQHAPKQGAALLLIHGTAEVEARLHLPSAKALEAGTRTVAQLELKQPLAGRFGDRFIVRLPTPQFTVAGGRLLDPSPHRYGRRHEAQWQGLSQLSPDDFAGYIRFRLAHEPVISKSSLYPFSPGTAAEFDALVASGVQAKQWEQRSDRLVRAGWLAEMRAQVTKQVKEYHRAQPSHPGPASADLLSELPENLHGEFVRELEADGVRAEGPYLCHQSHRAGLTSSQERLAEEWRQMFSKTPYSGPTRPELLAGTPDARPTLEFLLKSGEFTELKEGVLLKTTDFERAVRMIVETLKGGGELTVAALRDALGASRKFALPILDRCDRLGYTKRVGDTRVLGPRAAELPEERKA